MITRLTYFLLGAAFCAATILGYPYVFPKTRTAKAPPTMEEMTKARLAYCKEHPYVKSACGF